MSEEQIRHANPKEGFDHTEPQSMAILGFGIGSALLLILTIFALEQYFNKIWQEAVYEKVLAPPSEQLKELHYREDWYLTHYHYTDKKTGRGADSPGSGHGLCSCRKPPKENCFIRPRATCRRRKNRTAPAAAPGDSRAGSRGTPAK